jgi:hypothetical protein
VLGGAINALFPAAEYTRSGAGWQPERAGGSSAYDAALWNDGNATAVGARMLSGLANRRGHDTPRIAPIRVPSSWRLLSLPGGGPPYNSRYSVPPPRPSRSRQNRCTSGYTRKPGLRDGGRPTAGTAEPEDLRTAGLERRTVGAPAVPGLGLQADVQGQRGTAASGGSRNSGDRRQDNGDGLRQRGQGTRARTEMAAVPATCHA